MATPPTFYPILCEGSQYRASGLEGASCYSVVQLLGKGDVGSWLCQGLEYLTLGWDDGLLEVDVKRRPVKEWAEHAEFASNYTE